ncbi:MAG: universal stress protein, partial [bacterium]
MRKMIIPINFSKKSLENVYFGVGLAKDLGYTKVELVNVIDVYSYNINADLTYASANTTAMSGANAQFYQKAVEARKNYVNGIISTFLGKIRMKYDIPVDFILEEGIVTDFLIELSQEETSGMMLLNKNDKLQDTSISMINRIVRKANCPIMVINEGYNYSSFQNILYATDFREDDLNAIQLLEEIIKTFDSNLEITHVSDHVEFEDKLHEAGMAKLMKERTGYRKIDVQVAEKKKNVADTLNGYAVEKKKDLIVLLRENHGLFKELFGTDHTKQIIKTSG